MWMAALLTSPEPSGPRREGDKEISFQYCPVCNNDGWNTSMNIVTGAWICFWCDARGKAKRDVSQLRLFIRPPFQSRRHLVKDANDSLVRFLDVSC